MIDEVKLVVKAGDGGDGKVSFRRRRGRAKGGPDGGKGGNGGDLYFQADPGLNTLRFFAGRDKIKAESGQNGGNFKKTGKSGEDITLKVPVGTIIWQITKKGRKKIVDLDKPRVEIKLCRGGKGGRGNWFFRSAVNQAPRFAEKGKPGEEKEIKLELKVLAQVGLVGLPNAGKSTLLSLLTAARPKIGSYPFTTLSPNLGVIPGSKKGKGLIVTDIPGLIKGASEGRGLGFKFLRHIERCQILVYILFPKEEQFLIKSNKLAKKIYSQKKKVKKELKAFNIKLIDLPSLTVVNKKDLLNKKQVISIKKYFAKKKQEISFISAKTGQGIKPLVDKIKKLYLEESSS